MKRAAISWALTALLAGAGCSGAPPAPDARCEGCNVVLLSFDTLRSDHLGAYGYHRDTSPRIDRFASESWLFTEATAPAPWTLPSHVSMLTGLSPARHGVRTRDQRIGDDVPMLPEILHRHSYRTGGFTGGGYVSERYRYRRFDTWDESGGSYGQNFNRMMAWLASAEEPFFLFYHDYQVHCPYDPPPRFDRFSDPDYAGVVETDPRKPAGAACSGARVGCEKRCATYFARLQRQLEPADFRHVVDKYDGEIRTVDWRMGWLLDLLDTRGIRDRTLVIFTSDHGETFGRGGKVGHNGLYQEFLEVPLILSIPGQEPRRVDAPVTSMDIVPTVLALLDLPAPPDLDGRSLLEPLERGRAVISEHVQHAPTYSIRRQAQKLIWHADEDRREYFDLEADPGETRNLAGSRLEEEELTELLRTYAEDARPPSSTDSDRRVETTPEQEEQLRALGYLE